MLATTIVLKLFTISSKMYQHFMIWGRSSRKFFNWWNHECIEHWLDTTRKGEICYLWLRILFLDQTVHVPFFGKKLLFQVCLLKFSMFEYYSSYSLWVYWWFLVEQIVHLSLLEVLYVWIWLKFFILSLLLLVPCWACTSSQVINRDYIHLSE